MQQKQHAHGSDYIWVNVRRSALRKTLASEMLHVSDIQCDCAETKKQLQTLLMQALCKCKA
ncbi:hypothetical protein [Alteromonas sp. CYL-A6]|uniref:hypothetical protein n=1 Tax=Alteromonas nitratireducens TaxID=3390813 RepID=UPI0034B05C65